MGGGDFALGEVVRLNAVGAVAPLADGCVVAPQIACFNCGAAGVLLNAHQPPAEAVVLELRAAAVDDVGHTDQSVLGVPAVLVAAVIGQVAIGVAPRPLKPMSPSPVTAGICSRLDSIRISSLSSQYMPWKESATRRGPGVTRWASLRSAPPYKPRLRALR